MASTDVTHAGGFARRRPEESSTWVRDRNLLSELVRRELKARYRGSNLGVLWSLLNPLLYMVIYSVVFSQFIRFPIKGAAYPVFLLAGLLSWNFFSQALMGSVNSVLGNATVVKKVAFPWVLLTVASVIAAAINYLISLILLVPVLLIFHAHVGLPLLVLPVIVLVMLMMALGLGLLVAAGNVYFRDIEYLLNIGLQVGFFLTPVIYSLDLITNKLSGHSLKVQVFYFALQLNPMAWIATSFQDVLAFDRMPVHRVGLLYSAAFSVVALGVGLLIFRRLQGRFAEEL